ncbi:LAMI_0C00936g1_1 [Lachancea mirantina]|uniref:Nascent polypeptide-associated complex subunit alpha n=1 Tax=Lachancea mirantina TaxID=1230905 RepID=A0A1G4IZR9_9SACH|nr:LAMI_0C00936g1_1 [Lachancea mirantina]
MSTIEENSNVSIFNKNEKKARELIGKLGLKQIPGIARVTFRKKNNQIYAIEKPEVYRTAGGNFVVFGEPKVDDFTQRLAKAQQEAQLAGPGLQTTGAAEALGKNPVETISKDPQSIQADMVAAAEQSAGKEAVEETSGPVDESGLSGEDIELVMQQANVSRDKAAKALRDHNSDIVNAIMSLS